MTPDQELETVLDSLRELWKERAHATLPGERVSLGKQINAQYKLLGEVLNRA